MADNFGIYKAIVTDNSGFFNTGKIKVRVQNLYNTPLPTNLTQNYSKDEFVKSLIDDIDALVYSPIGGGSNYGLLAIPQVNSVGIVQFLNGNINVPVWMGGLFTPTIDPSTGGTTSVNIPNDNPLMEGAGSDGASKGPDDSITTKKISGSFGTIILRTKTTKASINQDTPDSMDFDKARSENLIVISDDEVKIIHFLKWKEESDKSKTPKLQQWEEVVIGNKIEVTSTGTTKTPQISAMMHTLDNQLKNETLIGLTINESTASLVAQDTAGNILNSVSANSKTVSITSTDTKKSETVQIELTPTKASILNKTVSVVIEQNEATISVPEGKLRLSGKEVVLGDGGGYVMIKDNQLPVRLEDGSILKASNVRA